MIEELKNAILDDATVYYIPECTPWVMGGGFDEFAQEASVVLRAISKCGAVPCSDEGRIGFVIRAFYFLGVQRGAEALRVSIAETLKNENADKLLESLPFDLDEVCADVAIDDFELHHKELTAALSQLGVLGNGRKARSR